MVSTLLKVSNTQNTGVRVWLLPRMSNYGDGPTVLRSVVYDNCNTIFISALTIKLVQFYVST